MNSTKIKDGVDLLAINSQKFSTETLAITFLQPISKVNPSFMSVLPYVLLAGCNLYPTIELINKKLDSLYGAKIEPMIRKKGEYLCLTFICDVIDQKFISDSNLLNDIFDLLCEIIYSPLIKDGSFDCQIIESEKNNLINRINGVKNDKRIYANQKMFEIMCKNEPFGISRLGTLETASKINETSLFDAYNDIISNSKVEIFYCGSNNVSSFNFDKIKPRKCDDLNICNQIYSPNVCEIIENMDITQGKLSIGFRTNTYPTDSDYPALVLFNSILGGSTSSKLFENVREEMSLCYYASSSIEKAKGVMSINSGIQVENFEIAKTAILKQFSDMKEGNFTNEQIDSAKLTVINSLNSANDSKFGIEDFYLTQTICGIDDDISKLVTDIDKTSKQQIVDCANKVKLDTIFFLKGDKTND